MTNTDSYAILSLLQYNAKRIRSKHRGYGLKNVRRCAEKYGGGIETSKDDTQFKVVVYLNNVSMI